MRIALGAPPHAVVGLVVRQGLRLIVAGVVVGVIGAYGLARAVSALVPGILDATDAATYVGVALLLGAIGAAATYIPARRATRIDPMVALRHD